MDRFQEIIWDLGEIIELPLHVDKNRACNLILDGKLEVQMQIDEQGENLLICAFIAEIPPGRFRENVLREALKVNGSYHPFGSFSFFEKKNFLMLHQYLPVEKLNGERLVKNLEIFIEEAAEWRSAIELGAPSPPKYTRADLKPPPFIK